jgi:hypothetical protein
MLIRISTLQPWQGEAINDIRHPLEIEALWSAAQLAEADLAIPLPFVPVAGKVPDGAPIYVRNADGSIGTTFMLVDAPPPGAAAVDAERDRRVVETFTYAGHAIALDEKSLTRITAMGADARFAQLAGAAAGNLRWADPNTDFGWIDGDNNLLPLDAPGMATMADEAKRWVSNHTFAARALKDLSPIPADFEEDAYWPAGSGA